jgi:signal peptidase I
MPLDVAGREIPGDRVVVNKAAYLVRSPARWEIVLLRLFGHAYIKRLLGLPGETILVHDGDLYANGILQRKTYAQAKQMRVPVSQGYSCALSKCEPIRDEYAYNAGEHADSECVHDFLVEADVQLSAGEGTLAFRLCDGHDWVEVRLPVGAVQRCEAFTWPMAEPRNLRKLADAAIGALQVGRRYHLEMAFVDRRLTLLLDDRAYLSVDLPEAKQRGGVVRPFQMDAGGVQAALASFQLYRDVHYGQQGQQAVHGKMVRLGVDQYFVLGDNSPHSEDSRHWPDEGRVAFRNLLGPLIGH